MGNFLSCYNFYITICFVLWWRLNLKLHVLSTFRVTRKFFEFYNTVVDMLRFRFFRLHYFLACFSGLPVMLYNRRPYCCGALWVCQGNRLHFFRIISRLFFVFGFFFLCKCVCLYSFCLLTSRCSPMRDYREIVVVQSD